MRKVVLLSGGMDSFVASKLFKPDVNLHVDFNERWSDKQRQVLTFLDVPNLEILAGLDLSPFVGPDNVYLPNRNVLMITLAQLYGDEIVLSSTRGAVHPDKDGTFALRMSDMLSYVHKRKIQVLRPFGNMTKYEIVKAFIDAGNPIEELYATTSCYSEKEVECLTCRSCLRRLVAFAQHGYRLDDLRKHSKDIKRLLDRNQYSANLIENKWALQLLDDLGCNFTSLEV